jgi:hypothetical protein
MMSLEDPRWLSLTGGYKTPFDPRLLLKQLEVGGNTAAVWQSLWENLHHQGDIGEASFAAAPFLVYRSQERGRPDWNTYAMVAIIELARKQGKNPDVPDWIADDYFRAIRTMAEIGATQVLHAETEEEVRAILSIIAIKKGLRTHGKFLVSYSDDELMEM